MVGTVLAMSEIGYLICSPIVSMTMARVGRKNYIILGNLAQILSALGFGILAYIKNDTVFYVFSLFLRFMQGFGDSAGTTGFFSIIAIEFSKEQELYFGYFECAVGIGLMLGPVIG